MSLEIDIRAIGVIEPDAIRFADDHPSMYVAQLIKKESDGNISIADGTDTVRIISIKDARNMIRALEYAIEKGWIER